MRLGVRDGRRELTASRTVLAARPPKLGTVLAVGAFLPLTGKLDGPSTDGKG